MKAKRDIARLRPLFAWALVLFALLIGCQKETATPILRLQYELTQFEPTAAERVQLGRSAGEALREGRPYLLVQGFACDTGGYAASIAIAARRGQRGAEALRGELRDANLRPAGLLIADPAVLAGAPRQQQRRIELSAFASREQMIGAFEAANRYAAQANRNARAGQPAPPAQTSPAAFPFQLLALVLLILLILALLFWFWRKRGEARRRRHQLSSEEAQSIAILTGGAVQPLAPENEAVETGRSAFGGGRLTREGGVRGIMKQFKETQTMGAKKKKSATKAARITPISIRGAVDKPFEQMTLRQLSNAPVHALEGLTPRHARLLEEAFGIKSLEDLARLKYVEIARAICILAQYED